MLLWGRSTAREPGDAKATESAVDRGAGDSYRTAFCFRCLPPLLGTGE